MISHHNSFVVVYYSDQNIIYKKSVVYTYLVKKYIIKTDSALCYAIL